jgi:hypothetical protein
MYQTQDISICVCVMTLIILLNMKCVHQSLIIFWTWNVSMSQVLRVHGLSSVWSRLLYHCDCSFIYSIPKMFCLLLWMWFLNIRFLVIYPTIKSLGVFIEELILLIAITCFLHLLNNWALAWSFHFHVLFHFFDVLVHFIYLECVFGLQVNLACGDSFLEFI